MTQKNYFYPIRTDTLPYTHNFDKPNGQELQSWFMSVTKNGSTQTSNIQNGKWRVAVPASHGSSYTISKFYLQGDFDVEYKIDMPVWNEVADSQIFQCRVLGDGANVEFSRRQGSRVIVSGTATGGTYDVSTDSDTSYHLRFTRVGSDIQVYKWTGSWTALGVPITELGTQDVQVMWATNNGATYEAYTVEWYDFVINSADGIRNTVKMFDEFEGGNDVTQTHLTYPWTDDMSQDIVTGHEDWSFGGNMDSFWTHNAVDDRMELLVAPNNATPNAFSSFNVKVWEEESFEYHWDVDLINIPENCQWTWMVQNSSGSNRAWFQIDNLEQWFITRKVDGVSDSRLDMSTTKQGRILVRFRLDFTTKILTIDYKNWETSDWSAAWVTPSANHTVDFSGSADFGTQWKVACYPQFWSDAGNSANFECHLRQLDIISGTGLLNPPRLTPNPETPTENWWSVSDPAYASVMDDALRMEFPNDGVERAVAVLSRFGLSGDFDIQLDYDIVNSTTPTSSLSYSCEFSVYVAGDAQYAYINRAVSFGGSEVYTSGGIDFGYGTTATTDTASTVRITRVSGELRAYYWTGSQWEWGGDTNGRLLTNSFNGTVNIRIGANQRPDSNTISNLTNFVINSCDNIVWQGGTLKRFEPETSTAPWTETFTGIEGDPPNPYYWTSGTIQNDKLYFGPSSGGGGVNSTFFPTGDFDVQVDFDLIQYPASERWTAWLVASLSAGAWIKMGYEYRSGEFKYHFQYYNGGFTDHYTAQLIDTSGKLRIVRSGNSYTGSYWNGSSFTDMPTITTSGETCTNFRLERYSNGPTTEYNYDNFKVNSGGIDWNGAGEWNSTHMNRYDGGQWTDSILNAFNPYASKSSITETFDTPLNETVWTVRGSSGAGSGTIPYIESQRLKLSPNQAEYSNQFFEHPFRLNGDFSVTIEFDLGTVPHINLDWYYNFKIYNNTNGSYGATLFAFSNGTIFRLGSYCTGGGADVGNTDMPGNASTGKLRWTKTGSTVVGEYDINGSGWTVYQTAYDFGLAGDECRFAVYCSSVTTPYVAYVDNVSASADSITWNGGGERGYTGNV